MIGKKEQFDYLFHRIGEKQLVSMPRIQIRALEGNREAPDFLKSYGNTNISAYVGFIDLAEYSSKVKGKSPEEISNYLNPFLTKIVDVLYDCCALVDKMIGDEIMFVLPEIEEDKYALDELLHLGQIMGFLHDLAYEHQDNYKYRIGLSYGKVNVYQLKGRGYSEWSIVGEPIHVAKRLHVVDELISPNPVAGAFGLSLNSKKYSDVTKTLEIVLGFIAGFASRFDHKIIEEPRNFKGVGLVSWAYLFPKGPSEIQGT